jgi:hypothetical protein
MKTYRTLTLTLLFASWLTPFSPAQAKEPLTNEGIQQMVGSGLQDDVVIGAIFASDVNFDVTPNCLLALKKANVDDKIIQAMLTVQKKKREDATRAAAPPMPATTAVSSAPRIGAMGVPLMNSGAAPATQLPKVALVVGDKKLPIQPSTTEIAQSKGKGGPAAGSILKGVGKGMMMAGGIPGAGGSRGGAGMPRLAYTWALPGRTSQSVLPDRTPGFEIEFGDIPGIDPDGYEPVVVKLVQTKDNWRLVETSKDKFDKHGNDTRSTRPEDQIPLRVALLDHGHLLVAPASELAPGEYGLVLHPKKEQKQFAGVPAPNIEALFYSVWDFSVPAEETAASARPQEKP